MSIFAPAHRTRGPFAGSVTVLVITGILVAGTACSSSGGSTSGGPPTSPAAVPETDRWPGAMVALGHSGLTGYGSDDDPSVDAPDNSWATGTNPDVDSVYLRLLAVNPAIDGRAWNLAVDGADVGGLLRQADRVGELDPKPELVLIQSIDNDMKCDGTDDANLPVYREQLGRVLDTITSSAPAADILFVSQWGTAREYSQTVAAIDPRRLAGNGPCDVMDPTTLQLVPSRVDGVQDLVDAYFDAITQVCADYPNCRTDGGAMQQLDLDPGDLTPDTNHLSVAGQAKMAALVWQVLYPGG